MEFTAKQIASYIGGKVEGDDNSTVNTFAKIEEGKAGAISFLSNPKYIHYIYDTESSIVLIDNSMVLDKPVKATLIRVDNAYECVAKLASLVYRDIGIYYASAAHRDPVANHGMGVDLGAVAYGGAVAYASKGTNVNVVADCCRRRD